MTPNDWWHVGSRLLGVYFLVIGALTAMGSLMFLGAEIPGTSSRWPFLLTPIAQAAVFVAAGSWLVRRSSVPRASVPTNADAARLTFIRALQFAGIFFLVTGAIDLAKAAVDSYYIEAGYQLRAGDIAAGGISAAAGALLAFRPSRIADRLPNA